MNFEFSTVGRIIFGIGRFAEIGDIARSFGRRAFIVTGRHALSDAGIVDKLKQNLEAKDVEFFQFSVSSEPTVEILGQAIAEARERDCDLVIGLGGGSAIDTAKAISGLLTNGGSVLDYMEVVGKGQPMTKPAAPFIAIPTTAGTGAEATCNAVIRDSVTNVKASVRSQYLFSRVALLDPELTYSLPPDITASTGLDALTQLIEPYTSKRAQPITDALAQDGIRRVGRSLVKACEHGDDAIARGDMAFASLESGIALTNAGLGAVHGLAAPLGGQYPVPHGVACACLLPHVMQVNVRALAKEPANPILHRYADVAEWLTGKRLSSERDTIDSGIQFIRELCVQLKVPSLAQFGIKPDDIPAIARQSSKSSSMRANSVTFTQEELEGVLTSAIG